MVTHNDIEAFIKRIPPTPKAVQTSLMLLQQGELAKAADAVREDLALRSYLKEIVNKPIYGFQKEITDIRQIFSILGVNGALQCVYNYLLSALSPKKWEFFKLNKHLFIDLQAELTASWEKILAHLDVNDRETQLAITLLPAAVLVAEALFASHKEEVKLLRTHSDIDLDTLLKRLANASLFDIAGMIAKKWEMQERVIRLVKLTEGNASNETPEVVYAKWMHLLLFYTLSKPRFIEAGLNDFIEFRIDFVEDIYEKFAQVMEIEA